MGGCCIVCTTALSSIRSKHEYWNRILCRWCSTNGFTAGLLTDGCLIIPIVGGPPFPGRSRQLGDSKGQSPLPSFYGANELLGLFLFLFIEEAGVPLWFLPGDVLVMLAGSRPGRPPGSVVLILLAATAGVSIGSSLLYLVVRCG